MNSTLNSIERDPEELRLLERDTQDDGIALVILTQPKSRVIGASNLDLIRHVSRLPRMGETLMARASTARKCELTVVRFTRWRLCRCGPCVLSDGVLTWYYSGRDTAAPMQPVMKGMEATGTGLLKPAGDDAMFNTLNTLGSALAILSLIGGNPFQSAASAESALQRVDVPESTVTGEIKYDIGQLIATGRIAPATAIVTEPDDPCTWLLRTPDSPPELRWPKILLNAGRNAPALSVDLQLRGTYDVYVQVRAVNVGSSAGGERADDGLPMAFELALDDGSRSEIVGAKGFPGRHFDVEMLAGSGWSLTNHRLIVRSLGKPVYLYGFRFVPTGSVRAASSGTVRHWLATDHVRIVQERDKHFAFPGVALLPDDELVVVYREATMHGIESTGKVSLSRSRDGGHTWLPRVTALDRPDVDDRDPSIFQMRDGTLLLFSADVLCTSRDGGRSWSEPVATPVFGPKGGVEDDEGHILYGGLKRVVQADFTCIQDRSALLQADAAYRSHDHGRSWEPAGIATYTIYMEGNTDYVWYDEPFLCVMPNQYWIFCARVDLDGFARIIRSPDRGRTWEAVRKTSVWGYPQHLLPLRDGRLLMTYGYRRAPFGVRACLSCDQGRTWDVDNEIVLRMDGGTPPGQSRIVDDGDLGYPTSIQLADGNILTVYYHNTAGSNCFIAGTFWQLPLSR